MSEACGSAAPSRWCGAPVLSLLPESERRAFSVVVPIYNERENLQPLLERIHAALAPLGRSYEVLCVDDGSRDGSLEHLLELRTRWPASTRVLELGRNHGQHLAVLAGLRQARGEVVVTLDADLQNPPEEIPRLLERIEAGHDLVSGYREERHDGWQRRWASRAANALRRRLTSLELRDHGCMLRAYRRDLVELMLASRETVTFIPALAALLAAHPTELRVGHAARASGESKYDLYRLIRLYIDLLTGFSTAPLQLFTLAGLAVSALSAALVGVLALRRLWVGPEVEGVFTLLGIVFFLLGVCITGIGITGEYVSRIYAELKGRHQVVVRRLHG
jgi:undecaprenyl-phosphate 4-deoxy-4-formamido-L-arabinose transferase